MEKSVLKSKTFWLQVLVLVGMLVPAVGAWVSENPGSFSMIWGGLNLILRMVTKDKLVLVEK